MKTTKAKEFLIKSDNKIGTLADLSKVIASRGVNIRAISAWNVDDEAFFRMITSDNTEAEGALKDEGYSFKENDVVVVELPDKVGELNGLANKLKSDGIDLTYVYGTTSKPEYGAIIVLSSNNNDKAIELLTS